MLKKFDAPYYINKGEKLKTAKVINSLKTSKIIKPIAGLLALVP